MQWSHSASLESFLDSSEAAPLFTEMVVAVRRRGRWSWASWSRSSRPDDRSIFDLASLTKPLMATLALELDRSGELPLSLRVDDLWPDAPTTATLGDLLRHRSGLVAWLPIYRLATGAPQRPRSPSERRQLLLSVLGERQWWGRPQRLYSDLGYMLWGVLAEAELGRDLTELWEASSVGHAAVRFGGGPDVRPSPIGTAQEMRLGAALGLTLPELGPPQASARRAEVQDGNARFLGATAHAGLFGGLKPVCEWLESRWVTPRLRRTALDDLTRPEVGGSWFRPAGATSCGRGVSALAFGHTGFVGGALWIDPAHGRAAVCLANRRSPTQSIETFRAELFTALLSPQGDW